MTRAKTHESGNRRKAFTLAEVLVCCVLVVLGFVALVTAFGHESVVTQRGEDITLATHLADEIRDKALQMNFSEVLAMDGTTNNPAILSTGSSDNLADWAQKITVRPVSSSDLNQEVEAAGAEAARLTVEIFAKRNPVFTQAYYILDVSGVPTAGGS